VDSLNVGVVRDLIGESIAVKQRLAEDDAVLQCIVAVAKQCVAAFRTGNKVLLAGNGGSAADAQHIAAEIVSRFEVDRPGLPAIALNTDTSMLTAIGNDYGYEAIFQRQLEANGVKGDIFIGISTSGNSQNVVNALLKAREMGILAVGLSGANGGRMAEVCDTCIRIPSASTPRIQEAHITVGHIICAMVENELFGQYRQA
jgi:D-sedoheptulose 7-phosphate isomerase